MKFHLVDFEDLLCRNQSRQFITIHHRKLFHAIISQKIHRFVNIGFQRNGLPSLNDILSNDKIGQIPFVEKDRF